MPTSRADLKFIGDLELETFGSSNQVPTINLDNNFTNLRQKLNLLVDYCKNNTISLGESNVYTAKQTFNIESDFVLGLRTPSIQAINLNTTSSLKKNGVSAKWNYEDGSSDQEIATKGYVQSVAFVAGNVPAGGTSNTYLRGDGTWQAIGLITDPAIRTSGFTAVNGTRYHCDSTSGAFTVTLPLTPTAGQRIGIIDVSGSSEVNNITINRNGSLIMNLAEDMTISSAYSKVYLVYNAVRGWVLI